MIKILNKNILVTDPIDGTQNYSNGGLNYTINIALIDQGEPVLGIIDILPQSQYGLDLKILLIKKLIKKYFLKTITKLASLKL